MASFYSAFSSVDGRRELVKFGMSCGPRFVVSHDSARPPDRWSHLPMPTIDQRDALHVLTKPRLLEIAAALGLGLPGRLLKPELVDAIAASHSAPFPRILKLLRRDELKTICRSAGLDESGSTGSEDKRRPRQRSSGRRSIGLSRPPTERECPRHRRGSATGK